MADKSVNVSVQRMTLSQQIIQLEEEYNNFIDSSDTIMQYYQNQQVSGLDTHFLKIEEWLDQPRKAQGNTPLVIEAEDGVGKKQLLVKWIQYHAANKKSKRKDIIIPHFAMVGGNNSNYFYAIYRILIKLRELLNINQKVELLEEKLRKYFAYWMDVCNQELENQIIKDSKILYDRIILIFEGVDHFVDQGNGPMKEANIAFWLPQYFPDRIKVIVTTSKHSEAMQYFKKINLSTMLHIKSDSQVIRRMIENHQSKKIFLSDGLKDKLFSTLQGYPTSVQTNPIFCKTFLALLIPYPSEGIIGTSEVKLEEIERISQKLDFNKLKQINSLEELFDYVIDFYRINLFQSEQKFIKTIMSFTITQKGLTVSEIMEICKITMDEWKLFLAYFKVFLMHHRQYWIINNDLFKGVLLKKFQNSIDKQKLHEEISDSLEQTPNSIRKLEEQTYHLFMGKSYFKLKETIAIIENFLLLFNPDNKYDLCRFWQKLEEQGFDPVIEYNKAIEGFHMQFHPTSEDIFRIIVQVSRFLKEFGDFETYFTPTFRHPPIQAIEDEFDDIGLLGELKRMNLCCLIDPVMKPRQKDDLYKSPQEKIAEKIAKQKEKQSKKVKTVPADTKQDQKSDQVKEEKKPKPDILSRLEKLNVDIPYNRQEVKKFYEEKIGLNNQLEETMREQVEEANVQGVYNSISSLKDLDGIKQQQQYLDKPTKGVVQQVQFIRQDLEINDRKPTDYYYKRWLWIQFPWTTLSMRSDYSAKMKQCFAKATEYMTVQEEKNFTKQALQIAIEAKLKKKMMYQKQVDTKGTKSYSEKEFSIIKNQEPQNNSMVSFARTQSNLGFLKKESSLNQLGSRQGSTKHQYGQAFFLTEDYLDMDVLQREMENNNKKHKKLPDIQQTQQSTITDMNNTLRILDKSRTRKEKTKPFEIESVMNLTSQHNQLSILPKLKGSINNHSMRELQIMQQQARALQKEYDNLSYQNQSLAKKLQQIRTLQSNATQNDGESSQTVENKIYNLNMIREKAENDFMLSVIYKDRLRTIIKICADNKSYNEEWIRDLNYLLSNLNKLIKYEQVEIDALHKRKQLLYNTHTQFVDAFNESMVQQRGMHQQINKSIRSKEELDQFFQNSDGVIELQSIEKIQKLEKQYTLKQERETVMNKRAVLEKNSQSIQQKLENLTEQMSKLCQHINIKNPQYQQVESFKIFLNNLEVKIQLKAKIIHLGDVYEGQKLQVAQQKQYVETFLNANLNESNAKKRKTTIKLLGDRVKESETIQTVQDKSNEIRKQNVEKQKQLKKLEMLKLDCQLTMNNLHSKVTDNKFKSIEQLKSAELLPKINESLIKLQNLIKDKLGEEQFKLFLAGSLDMGKFYKAAYQYAQDPQLFESIPT